jgi:hypothetical protein
MSTKYDVCEQWTGGNERSEYADFADARRAAVLAVTNGAIAADVLGPNDHLVCTVENDCDGKLVIISDGYPVPGICQYCAEEECVCDGPDG